MLFLVVVSLNLKSDRRTPKQLGGDFMATSWPLQPATGAGRRLAHDSTTAFQLGGFGPG